MSTHSSLYTRTLKLAVVLALTVIVLGAYTRLSDAGLGCPDWPGCYGHIGVPKELSHSSYDRPLEHAKAWKEMIHRYAAGALGIVILLIVFLVIRKKTTLHQSITLPIVLLLTVVFQALLGMWTVTMLLSPMIVSAHLIGGFTTLALLWWLLLNQIDQHRSTLPSKSMKVLAAIGLLLVILQILLGGWTSTNYAALACGNDFPTCAGQWWPPMDFVNGFDLVHSSGTNYEFGVLESPARTAIQVAHRLGALVVFVYLLMLGIKLLTFSFGRHKTLGAILILFLVLQVTLGMMNVILGLPITIAVAHNLVAALLLLTVLTINHKLTKG